MVAAEDQPAMKVRVQAKDRLLTTKRFPMRPRCGLTMILKALLQYLDLKKALNLKETPKNLAAKKLMDASEPYFQISTTKGGGRFLATTATASDKFMRRSRERPTCREFSLFLY